MLILLLVYTSQSAIDNNNDGCCNNDMHVNTNNVMHTNVNVENKELKPSYANIDEDQGSYENNVDNVLKVRPTEIDENGN